MRYGVHFRGLGASASPHSAAVSEGAKVGGAAVVASRAEGVVGATRGATGVGAAAVATCGSTTISPTSASPAAAAPAAACGRRLLKQSHIEHKSQRIVGPTAASIIDTSATSATSSCACAETSPVLPSPLPAHSGPRWEAAAWCCCSQSDPSASSQTSRLWAASSPRSLGAAVEVSSPPALDAGPPRADACRSRGDLPRSDPLALLAASGDQPPLPPLPSLPRAGSMRPSDRRVPPAAGAVLTSRRWPPVAAAEAGRKASSAPVPPLPESSSFLPGGRPTRETTRVYSVSGCRPDTSCTKRRSEPAGAEKRSVRAPSQSQSGPPTIETRNSSGGLCRRVRAGRRPRLPRPSQSRPERRGTPMPSCTETGVASSKEMSSKTPPTSGSPASLLWQPPAPQQQHLSMSQLEWM
mmetsp:Transcript_1249/g.2870  ORF Transcript_1249/g.2870 Transcript_1249/m.2870 type:complete len:410 (+) Transcript_1249:205-1434(+)